MSDTRSAKSDGMKIDYTGDKTRDKCAELIYDALVFDSGARTSSAMSYLTFVFSPADFP